MILEMTSAHVRAAAQLHQRVLPDDLLSRLGVAFMERYLYRRVLASSSALGYVYVYDQQVVGYITGTINSQAFYRLNWREQITLPLFMLLSLARRPALAAEVKEALEFSRLKGTLTYIKSEIASVGVLPDYRSPAFFKRTRLNISTELHRHILRELRVRNAKEVFGIFRAENTLAILTYQNLGFTLRQEFMFRGSRRLVLGCDLHDKRVAQRLGPETGSKENPSCPC